MTNQIKLFSTLTLIVSLFFITGCTPESAEDLGIKASGVSFTMTLSPVK
ncbi:MAG: hypothetical protein WDN26_05135 [Chitinophagaceae bacterium]